ncbi:MerR family transcriptional regulator [Thiohalorhabdus sp. Cl-TMA]|uniref:MerR family transcriptional regulator n=1 Tax=Thiohalorhabdus methylotrophus TaxID=3242694 RepID=A0ABV4TYH5_9GAMM
MSEGAPLPDKRFFGIREAAELCGVEPHVLRYWEEEFSQLRPLRRSGNRRYYRPEDVRLVQRIRYLLWERKYTIEGARDRLNEGGSAEGEASAMAVLREVRGELSALLADLDAREKQGMD